VDGALAAGLEPFFPKLAITFAAPGHEGDQFDDGTGNVHNAQRFACRLVGECDAGCNFGAKNTLDFTYLSQLGASAEWVALCEAEEIERANGGYKVNFVDHGERGGKGSVTAERVVIAAGALGSTYLLLRSQEKGLDGLSDALGKRFNGNGDLLSFAFGVKQDDEPRVVDPGRGPVITAAALVKGDAGRGLFLEDGGGPNAVFCCASDRGC
jgi:cholesterol oxidase